MRHVANPGHIVGLTGSGDEAEMLAVLADYLAKRQPLIVTYNGRCFDLPVIAHRALHHGVPMPYLYEYDVRYRYSEKGHVDLFDQLSDYGAVQRSGLSLDAFARLIGLPGKMGIDGSQVDALVAAGEIEKVKRYCLSDVVQTAFLLLRFRLLQGRLPRTDYDVASASLRSALRKTHLCDELLDAMEARP